MTATYTSEAPTIVDRTVQLPIDMFDLTQTCAKLQIDDQRLLALVNEAELAAYNLVGQIRFRYWDVSALAPRLAIAA